MAYVVSYIAQNLVSGPKLAPRLEVRHVRRHGAGDAVNRLLNGKFPWRQYPIPVGISLDQDSTQQITAIALSLPDTAISISIDHSNLRELKMIMHDRPFVSLMSGKGRFGSRNAAGLYGSEYEEEYQNGFILVGFDMAKVALLVRKYVGIEVKGIDLGSLLTPNALAPWSPGRIVCARVSQSAHQWTVNKCWDERVDEEAFFMRAWLSQCIAERCQAELIAAVPLDTAKLNNKELEVAQEMVAEAFWLDQRKPTEVVSEFGSTSTRRDGKIEVTNERYKTRVRRSERQAVLVTTTTGREYETRARGVKGKTTTLGAVGKVSGDIESVRIVGRQDATNSERLADALLLAALQGTKTFRDSPFIRRFWFPAWKRFRAPEDSAVLRPETVEKVLESARLNESQAKVVKMAGSKERVVVVHGPPGTGKTTTIAAISRIWDLHDCPVWIIAHSNVAVKNIAVALHKRDVDFKILVSKEFYEEWHEHMYQAIESKLIRSDELPPTAGETERLLGSSCIVLSTLGMLSNPAMEERGVFKNVPVERLIVDEASQIRVFEFLHLFEMFPLEKIFFFGDPLQLPPFNADQVRGMKTVFDLEHLNGRESRFMLNVQYRMPVALGEFISSAVYDGKLESYHDITSPDCVLFVNVPKLVGGAEENLAKSWVNHGEIRAVVQLVKTYYQHREFAVVTPYDAQRGLIEKALKAEDLPWENAVFNIDSFQGNERDFIIISLVRTDRPGFLTSLNRLNVMLTRCKKGMVIVANRDFLESPIRGSNILVARFAAYWRTNYGHHGTWVELHEIINGSANVPGVAAPRPSGNVLVNYPSSSAGYRATGPSWASTAVGFGRVPQRYQGANGTSFDVSRLFARPAQPKPLGPLFGNLSPSGWEPTYDDDWGQEEDSWGEYFPPPSPVFSGVEPPSTNKPVGYTVPDHTFLRSFPSLSAPQQNRPLPRLHTHSLVGSRANAWSRSSNTSANATSPTYRSESSVTWTFVRSSDASFRPPPVSAGGSSQNQRSYGQTPRPSIPATTSFNSRSNGHAVRASTDLEDGWTRVQRRKGYGRKKNFATVTKSPAPVPVSKQAGRRNKGYRYWASLD